MNRKCVVCGSEYDYCPNCAKDANKPKWMIRYDKEPCKTIWDTLIKAGRNEISAAEALGIIERQNATPTDPGIVAHINTLRKSDVRPVAPVVEPAEEPVAEPEAVVEAVEEPEVGKKRFGRH